MGLIIGRDFAQSFTGERHPDTGQTPAGMFAEVANAYRDRSNISFLRVRSDGRVATKYAGNKISGQTEPEDVAGSPYPLLFDFMDGLQPGQFLKFEETDDKATLSVVGAPPVPRANRIWKLVLWKTEEAARKEIDIYSGEILPQS